ncbi:lanthionine synthetase C family protein [Spongiactinospora sp. TRM90649]|uniref:lanthionine synthetase C family protein n=1 Tax=Spongiactinospora sp. TRM90649 TaxID=3031114 RepID=UPI0023F754F4|nr:lanthionine synthetase C family protein [Spongiactinospora sp. TRM90649]MDF5758819.1 lanthionine synthetase C family protein [Spongiactinospora sp. TRM90649]
MNVEHALQTADRLAVPTTRGLPSAHAWWPQSLAHGAPGVALLHIEVAAAGLRSWQRVQDWLTVTAHSPITTGRSTGLFYGAPALAFTLAAAASVRSGAYRSALASLDEPVAADARRRVAEARARIAAGRLPALAEFDTIRGLAGIAVLLLRRDPGGQAVRAVLEYLVDLTRPVSIDEGKLVPGWWTRTGATGRPDKDYPEGHGNAGMAHGIGGPLAALAVAALKGVTVPGQVEAIETVCAWLDSWRTDTDSGPAWPYLISRAQLDAGPLPPGNNGPIRRPSWCYGSAGLGRAQQLAALATGNATRRRMAEHALIRAFSDPTLRAATTDASLCHGYAGLARIASRAADDAEKPAAATLRKLAAELLGLALAHPNSAEAEPVPGVLEGAAGVALAALTPTIGPPSTGWDTCLLIT